MKTLIITSLLLGLVVRGFGQAHSARPMNHAAQLKQEIALACKLTDKDQIRRMNELHQTLFKKVSRVVDHPDAIELVFEQPDSLISVEIGEFIRFERLCCPWLLFQVSFQSDNGPVSLKMGDSPKTKEMVRIVMELNKLQTPR